MQQLSRRRVKIAAIAVMAVFFANGFAFASWASRIPTVKYSLDLDPHEVGLILLIGSLGSVIALPIAGRLIEKWGAFATSIVGVLLAATGLAVAVNAVPLGLPQLVAVGLFVAMAGIGSLDVAMNFAGTHVERGLQRAIMPWFHGWFSLGTVAGAGAGTLLVRAGVPITMHMWTAVLGMILVVILGARKYLPTAAGHGTESDSATESEQQAGSSGYLRGWLEGRTLLVGVIVLAASLTEGAANDWLALGIAEGFEVPEHDGALGLTVFVTAMTIMRFTGTWLLDRFGRVAVLRLCTLLAVAGLAVFGFAPTLPLAISGAVLWGLGAALGFPVGMSAAADDPLHAAARLSVVSTIGYSAFLAGPPLLGLLASHVGYRHSLLAILVPLIIGLLVTRAAATPADTQIAPGRSGTEDAGPEGETVPDGSAARTTLEP